MVAEFRAAHSYIAGPRIERQGLGCELYVFFTALAEGWRGPFFTMPLVCVPIRKNGYRAAKAALISFKYSALFEMVL